MPRNIFLFPGQGAQSVGMGREVLAASAAARGRFDEAKQILGYDLADVCLNGPKERLDSTVVSQPALFTGSLAALDHLAAIEPDLPAGVVAAAGLSLGEYTALTFAGALSFADGLRLVQRRGEAMQAAADATPSGMLSILGLELSAIHDIVAAASVQGFIAIANYLCPGNTVVSGTKAACAAVEKLVADKGGRSVALAVAGAFHTPLMKPADQQLADVLRTVTIHSPRIPVWSNVDAQPHSDPNEIRDLLVRQVLQPVKWEDIMRALVTGGDAAFHEIGPGRVLAGLLKRVDRKIPIRNWAF
jgi:[acyl-carrier-protein] S-malonyltransferase